MTSKIQQIIDRLKDLVTYKVDKSMSDEYFIADVNAVNFLCDLHDNLGFNRNDIRKIWISRTLNSLAGSKPRKIFSWQCR